MSLRGRASCLPDVRVEASAIAELVAIAAALGVASLRAPLFALRAARALAALRGAAETDDEDVEIAAALALGPRATRLPAQPEPPPEEPAERRTNRRDEERVAARAGRARGRGGARGRCRAGLLAQPCGRRRRADARG